MKKKLQIVIPCNNEEDNIRATVREILKSMQTLDVDYDILFIDDGSKDRTFEVIKELVSEFPNIRAVKLSRNFGKESALKVGLEYCTGDAAIVMDGDLQHPPHLIPKLVAEWEKGADIVDAVKSVRQKESGLNRIMGLGFNKVISALTGLDFTGASDFKLLIEKQLTL